MIRLIIPSVAALALLGLLLQPIHSRLIGLVSALLALLLVVWLVAQVRRLLRWVMVVLALALVPFALPGSPDPAEVHAGYLQRLRSYDGTGYVWGGEGRLGIDCSGLPRSAMIGSLFSYGLSHLDGVALRRACDLWWNDASAREMLAGYGGRMRVVGEPYRVNQLREDVQPGDLAVTVGGVHVMVYLDRTTVIQAEPGRGRVVTDAVPAADSWYEQPVRLVRWLP